MFARWKMVATITVTLLLLALASRLPLSACLHMSHGYSGKISQPTQEGVIFFTGNREELVLRSTYKIVGEKPPEQLAWVMTVPTLPDSYHVADKKLFAELRTWASQWEPKPQATKDLALAANSAPLELAPKVNVGPYEIQPIKARGAEALTALNEWFTQNGFTPVPPEHMTYFVNNNFTFLAVKTKPKADDFKSGEVSELPPLQISFATDKPYYPLKFFAKQGNISLRLYLFTASELDLNASKETMTLLNATQNHGVNRKLKTSSLSASLTAVLPQEKSGDGKGAAEWYLNILEANNFNTDEAMMKWEKDVFFSVK